MADKVKILVVGLGNMGASHADAYHRMDGYEIVGIMSRSIKSREDIPEQLSTYPLFEDFDAALAETKPDAVSINSWPNTHAVYALKAIAANCHVFMEKPIATNIEDAQKVVMSHQTNVVGSNIVLRNPPAKSVNIGLQNMKMLDPKKKSKLSSGKFGYNTNESGQKESSNSLLGKLLRLTL